MRTNPKTRWIAVIVVAVLVASFGAWVGTSGAAPPRKTVTILFAAYRWDRTGIGGWGDPSRESADFRGIGKGGLACASTQGSGGQASTTMWFDLPDGATITKITAYYQDLDSTYGLSFSPVFESVAVTDSPPQFPGPYDSVDMPTTNQGPYNGQQALVMVPTSPVVVDRHSPVVSIDGAGANREYGLSVTFGACGRTMDDAYLSDNFPPGFASLQAEGVSVEYIP